MARSLHGGGGIPVHFYYCVEKAGEAHFLDEFRALEEQRDDFEVTVVPRDTDGFLTAERLAAENADLESSDVLICGPPAMIMSLRSQLEGLGLPEKQVHAEEFGFAKRGPEAAPPAVAAAPADDRGYEPPPSRLPAVLFSLGFAVFAFAGGVLVGQNRAGGGAAATTTTPAIDTSPAAVAAGKAVYASSGCGACHVLAAAGSNGKIGPSLDGAKPSAALVVDVVTHGKGVMPSFGGRLTKAQIDDVAAFVSTSAS
jgi:mono/diheme cytochrome c family protein